MSGHTPWSSPDADPVGDLRRFARTWPPDPLERVRAAMRVLDETPRVVIRPEVQAKLNRMGRPRPYDVIVSKAVPPGTVLLVDTARLARDIMDRADAAMFAAQRRQETPMTENGHSMDALTAAAFAGRPVTFDVTGDAVGALHRAAGLARYVHRGDPVIRLHPQTMTEHLLHDGPVARLLRDATWANPRMIGVPPPAGLPQRGVQAADRPVTLVIDDWLHGADPFRVYGARLVPDVTVPVGLLLVPGLHLTGEPLTAPS